MTDENRAVLVNIIGAVESGGQMYGQRRYNAYVAPYTNSTKEHTITLGWAQNYGDEAYRLIKMIYDADREAFKKIDSEGRIQIKLISNNWVSKKWKPTPEERDVLIKLIDSAEGRKCQDKLFDELMTKYIADCTADYTSEVKAQMMYCEIRHLGGKTPVNRIFKKCNGNYSVDHILSVLKEDQTDTTNNNQVGDQKFWSRHTKCAEFINKYAVAEKTEERGKVMGITFGSARIGENGKITGGKAGDQTGKEVSMQPYYMHSKGWYCLRPKSAEVAKKIAQEMKDACNNENIGYNQNERYDVVRAAKKGLHMKEITDKVNSDCSSLIRACVIAASGIDPGDFSTDVEARALENTGLFGKRVSVTSESQLYYGDVLVTKKKGHTVVVVGGRPRKEKATEDWKATGTAVVAASAAYIRSTPEITSTNHLTMLNLGNRFEVNGEKSGQWVKVKTGSMIGWIHGSLIQYDNQMPKDQSVKRTTTEANVRRSPGVSNDNLVKTFGPSVPAGTEVRIEKEVKAKDGTSWSLCYLPTYKKSGYIASWLLK